MFAEIQRKFSLAIVFILLSIFLGRAQAANNVVPNQFIAKMYTEALGRAPDQSGWQNQVNYFSSFGCSATTLKDSGAAFYTSTEFNSRGYDNAAKVLSLYRGAFNREPDQAGFNTWYNMLQSGTSWTSVVNSFFTSWEFINVVVPVACSNNPYYWGNQAIINIPVSSTGNFPGNIAGKTQADLQALLNAKALSGGGIVYLEKKAVVLLTTPLIIPSSVTLATVGNLSSNQYALMGRLVRKADLGSNFVVKLQPNSKLLGVWVDGQHKKVPSVGRDSGPVTLGSNIQVTENRFSDNEGSNLVLNGRANGVTCNGTIVTGNFITGYATRHAAGNDSLGDGITNKCESATIENNEIIDVTDIGIVVFPAPPVAQRSIVRYNTVVNAGNSAVSAYTVGSGDDATDPLRVDFTGTQLNNNTMWTSRSAHFDITISVGSKAWFPTNRVGVGSQVNNNTTGSQKVNTQIGFLVAVMEYPTVLGNWIDIVPIVVNICNGSQSAGGLVSNDSLHNESAIQPHSHVASSLVTFCINH